MKLLKQILIILAISFIGELLKYLLPLPVPASIYGMVILFIGLLTGIIPLASVKDAGKFLIEIMPVMFIPAGVGLMSSWGTIKPVLLPVSIITVAALITVCDKKTKKQGKSRQIKQRIRRKKWINYLKHRSLQELRSVWWHI